jgi:hypothetical protein
MDLAVYSDLFKKNGDFIKAKGNLSKAIDIFKECGADGWAEKYEKELSKLTKSRHFYYQIICTAAIHAQPVCEVPQ